MWQLPKITAEEILLYSRKSRTDDATLTVEEILAKHEQMLDDWVKRNLPDGGPIPEENRFREVVSGETIESRPKIQELLRKIESPRYKAVLIVEPQRLSRGDLEDIGRMVKLLRYTNTLVFTIQYNYDLRDERDRDSFERELKRGNEYLEYQKKILNNGRMLSVQSGNFVANKPPYGYKKVAYKEGNRKCYTLDIIPEEAEGVRIMFEMYAKGYGATTIADRLMELGIRPRKNGVWRENTIRGILDNEHYLGKIRWNHKKGITTVKDGEIIKRQRYTDDYLLFPGKHPAIISQELWDAVQKIRGNLPRNRKAANFTNPFSGLLYCSCGKTMRRHAYEVRGEVRAEPRMQCSIQKHCVNASCRVSEIVEQVQQVLINALVDFELRVETGEDNSIEMHRQLVERLERRMEELNKLEISQWDKYTQEGMPKHIFDQLNSKVLAEKEEVQEALCTAKSSIPEPINFEEKITTFRQAIEMLNNPDDSPKELNRVLKSCIKQITYRRPKNADHHTASRNVNPIELQVELRR
jgi:DNA invertase Pin-like site-specific DNA recombinase